MSKNLGGPAFPAPNWHDNTPVGMNLRDYFAIRATEQDVENHRSFTTSHTGSGKHFTMTVEQAKYAYADAMIEARGVV